MFSFTCELCVVKTISAQEQPGQVKPLFICLCLSVSRSKFVKFLLLCFNTLTTFYLKIEPPIIMVFTTCSTMESGRVAQYRNHKYCS